MSLQTRITALAQAVGGDIKALLGQITSHFGSGGTAHANATTTVAGFLSAADKVKLDGAFPKSGGTATGNITVEAADWADVTVRAVGTAGDGATMHGHYARGTLAAMTPPLSGDALFGIGSRPYTGAGGFAAHSTGAIHFFARENISATNQGSAVKIAVTPLGTTWANRIHALSFEADAVGEGARIRGKFSGSPLSGRTYFQATDPGPTAIGVLANSALASTAGINLFGRDTPDTAPYFQMTAVESLGFHRILSGAAITGGAAPLPILFQVENKAIMRLADAFGYDTGSGGTVNQMTNKSNSVVLNKPSGVIKLAGDSIESGGTRGFVLYNSTITANSLVLVGVSGGAGASYSVRATNTSSGSVSIYIKNESSGSLAESVNIKFAVFESATS